MGFPGRGADCEDQVASGPGDTDQLVQRMCGGMAGGEDTDRDHSGKAPILKIQRLAQHTLPQVGIDLALPSLCRPLRGAKASVPQLLGSWAAGVVEDRGE